MSFRTKETVKLEAVRGNCYFDSLLHLTFGSEYEELSRQNNEFYRLQPAGAQPKILYFNIQPFFLL